MPESCPPRSARLQARSARRRRLYRSRTVLKPCQRQLDRSFPLGKGAAGKIAGNKATPLTASTIGCLRMISTFANQSPQRPESRSSGTGTARIRSRSFWVQRTVNISPLGFDACLPITWPSSQSSGRAKRRRWPSPFACFGPSGNCRIPATAPCAGRTALESAKTR